MSIYGNSNTPFMITVLVVAIGGMTAWCGYALWGQMKTADIQNNMRSLQLGISNYANDNGGYCPDDLGVLFDKSYCVDAKLYLALVSADSKLPRSGADVRAGLCDFGYLAKGMKINAKKVNIAEDDSHSFPMLYLKTPFRGEWLVVYSDGRPEAYETMPGFLKPPK